MARRRQTRVIQPQMAMDQMMAAAGPMPGMAGMGRAMGMPPGAPGGPPAPLPPSAAQQAMMAAQQPGLAGAAAGMGAQMAAAAQQPGLAGAAMRAQAPGQLGPLGPGPNNAAPGQDAALQAMQARMMGAQGAAPPPSVAGIPQGPPQMAGAGPPPMGAGTLADQNRAALAQAQQAPIRGNPGGFLTSGLAGAGLGAIAGQSGLATGVGAGAGMLAEYLKQRKLRNPARPMATGGLVEPVRMAMGGAAKVRKNFPHTPPLPKKNSHGNPLTARGMGKATRGGSFKGSL
jgi:hypothetical protein